MTKNAPLLLGIDGGGTSCRARICSGDGIVLGEGHAGSANVRLGLAKAGFAPIVLLGGMAGGLRPWLDGEVLAHLVEPRGTALDGAVLLARNTVTAEGTP